MPLSASLPASACYVSLLSGLDWARRHVLREDAAAACLLYTFCAAVRTFHGVTLTRTGDTSQVCRPRHRNWADVHTAEGGATAHLHPE